jgi:hypothetical protein
MCQHAKRSFCYMHSTAGSGTNPPQVKKLAFKTAAYTKSTVLNFQEATGWENPSLHITQCLRKYSCVILYKSAFASLP